MLFSYPDFGAVAVVVVLTVIVALGIKCSTRFSAIFVVVNILLLCFVTVCGIAFGHISNWTANWTSVEVDATVGGFMPFGWAGVLTGAATCFWAFSGFEMISCAVEESHSPQRHIPLATLLTMLIVTALYIGTSAGMTLLIPCELLDTGAPLPSAFEYAGLTWGQYIIAIGPLCGFTTTLISSSVGFVRIALAMAEDGLIWSWFANVSEFSQVPVLPVILCGVVQSVFACFCDIRDIISFGVSILLLSYVFTCVAVIVLRYSDVTPQQSSDDKSAPNDDSNLPQSTPQNGNDARELSSVASNDFSLSYTASENGTDANTSISKGNGGTSFSNSTFENVEDAEEIASTAEDGPICSSDCLLLDETRSAAAPRSLLPSCECLESFMICRSHICIKAALALMLMSMLGLAFMLIYGIVPLESGLWWSIVLVVLASCGVAFFMSIIWIHRQTLQTAVLTVSISCFSCYSLC